MVTAVAEDVGILDDVGASLASIGRLYCVQLSKYLSCLLLECFLLALRQVWPCDGQTTAWESLLDQHLSTIDLLKC